MPPGWDPDGPFVEIETLDEIDRLMREMPRGVLAAMLAGSSLHFNK